MKASSVSLRQWMHWSIPRLAYLFFGLLLLVSLTSKSASAQYTTGDVVGTVTDTTGAVVANANVTITNVGTQEKRQTHSSATGDFTFTLLQPGSYTVRVEASGFKTETITAFNVGVDDRVRANAQLQIGAATATVEVNGNSVPDLQTDSATIQSSLSEIQVQDLPLNNRNFAGLIQIAPGVNQGLQSSIASGTRPDDRRINAAYSANGQPDTFNNNMIDGLDNNEQQQGFMGVRSGVEGIASVVVMTNDYSAEIGRSTGAVVNVITKSGTNQFHGSAFEFFRNDALDARNAFATTGPKPEYRQNDFGGSMGGPIRRDKTFFFIDVEFDRAVIGMTSTETVPTAAEQADPTTLPGFPEGGTINPVGLNYFKLYPLPNLPGTVTPTQTVNNFVSSPSETQFGTTFDVRVDHHISAKDIIFGGYSYNPVSSNFPGPFPAVKPSWAEGATVYPGGDLDLSDGLSRGVSQALHLEYSHIFTPNLLLDLRAGFTRINIATDPLNYGEDLSNLIGIVNGNLPGNPQTSGLSPMEFNDSSSNVGEGSYIPILNRNNVFQYMGVLTWTKGSQTVKAGGALVRRQLNYYQSPDPKGYFQWADWADMVQGVPPNNAALTGIPNRGNIIGTQGLRTWQPSGFVQDDWHATKRLTLNLGVRYEIFTPFVEAHNLISNFDLSTLSVVVASSSKRSVVSNTDYSDVSPRLGFALSLPQNTVLRGGYGISYYPIQYQSMAENPDPPFSFLCYSGSCVTSVTNPTEPAFPVLPVPTFPIGSNLSGANLVGGLTYTPPDFKPAFFHQMNLMLQKEFAGNVLNVAWVATMGRRLLFQDNIDWPAPSLTAEAPSTPPAPLVYGTQLPNVGAIQRNSNLGEDNYNSLQVSFVRHYSKGLTINSNYTWAHGLGDATNPSQNNQNGLWTGNAHYDYGNTVMDIRHRIAFAGNYELPFGKNLQGAAGYLGKGWQLNMIAYWQTGSAFGIQNCTHPQINLIYDGCDRPDQYASYSLVPASVIALANSLGTPVQCLGPNNTGACFAPQAFGTAGDARENSEYGPHQRAVNLSMFKNFDLMEKTTLQFRAETFNITNTPNLGTPNGNFGTAGFGTIGGTASNQNPRQIQLALKLLF